jgi:hypothetical protein
MKNDVEERFIDPFSYPLEKTEVKTVTKEEKQKPTTSFEPMIGVFYRNRTNPNEIVYVYNTYGEIMYENEDTAQRCKCTREFFLKHYKQMIDADYRYLLED